MKQYLFLGLSWEKKIKSKCTSVKGTGTHMLCSQKQHPGQFYEREEPNPVLLKKKKKIQLPNEI